MTYYPAINIIEIERVRKATERFGESLLKRLFTEGERAYCEGKAARHQHLACRLAAKTAVRKAFREAGLRAPPWQALEVKRDEWGKPSISCTGVPRSCSILLSLSHSHRYAVASVIIGRQAP
jgi:holo-[acyl-carrier protein] synthase